MTHARVALHEAGHTVVGHVLGVISEGVVVLDGHSGLTHGLLPSDREMLRQSPAEWSATLQALAMTRLAGEAALEVLGDPEPRRGADQDRDQALRIAARLDPPAPAATLERLYARAVELAREHRAAVERFAETLHLNAGRLAGVDVADAVAAASAGWPAPRFGAERDAAIASVHRARFELALAEGPNSAAVAWITTLRDARAQVDRRGAERSTDWLAGRLPGRLATEGD